jgi:hypothetical protein
MADPTPFYAHAPPLKSKISNARNYMGGCSPPAVARLSCNPAASPWLTSEGRRPR